MSKKIKELELNTLRATFKGVKDMVLLEPLKLDSATDFDMRKKLREKKIRVYFADMVQIAREVASVADLQMRMQGIVLLGAFLKLTPYGEQSGMTDEQVYVGVEKALRKYFGKRGERVVQDNMTCVKRGYSEMQEVPREMMKVL